MSANSRRPNEGHVRDYLLVGLYQYQLHELLKEK